MSSAKTAALVVGGLLVGAAIAHARRGGGPLLGDPPGPYTLEDDWGDPPYAVLKPTGATALPATYVRCQDEHGNRLADSACAFIREKFGPQSAELVFVPITKLLAMTAGKALS
jgi:hypothetical protein